MIAVMILGVVAGAALPLQTNINTHLRQSVGSPFLATLLPFLIGTIVLLFATLAVDRGLPGLIVSIRRAGSREPGAGSRASGKSRIRSLSGS